MERHPQREENNWNNDNDNGLVPTHPISRRRFFKDRLRDLTVTGIGIVTTVGSYLYFKELEGNFENLIEQKCRQLGSEDCKQTDSQLYEELEDYYRDRLFVPALLGSCGVPIGAFMTIAGLSNLVWSIIKRRREIRALNR